MARILEFNFEKTTIECDCGNVFSGTNKISGFKCNKCGNFYEAVLNLCPEHMLMY